MKHRRPYLGGTAAVALVLGVGTVALPGTAFAATGIVQVGAGSYATIQPAGTSAPQSNIYRTANVSGPMPTNKWWSSVAWTKYSNTMYPNPFQITATAAGLQVNDPNVSASSIGIFSDPSASDFTLGSTASSNFPETDVDGTSDWAVSMKWDDGSGGTMRVTSGEGLPYLYATYTGGNPVLTFSGTPTVYSGNSTSNVLGIQVNGHTYGLFAPTGSTWSGIGTSTLTCNLPSGKNYFSVATLPDNSAATLQQYEQHAYAFITNTTVNYSVNHAASKVNTTYSVTTNSMQDNQQGTIFALYPSQWKVLNGGQSMLPYTYASVHGTMKTLAGSSFTTSLTYHGMLPYLPPVGNYDKSTLTSDVQSVANESNHLAAGTDTYYAGKGFGRLAQVIPEAQAVGDTTSANSLLSSLENEMSNYFVATDTSGNEKSSNLFWHDGTWGTLIGYPASFGSDTALNDHSFHYGYWIHAAAQIALDDPNWAAQSQWGGMVNMLVSDIANNDRSSTLFPFLRSFDPYAGHSWASGNAEFNDGNNLESSSEAIQAWSGLIEWAAATHQPQLEDLGIYLYTTESDTVLQDWFNVDGDNFPSSYPKDYTAMQWGGKSVYQTWFSADPEEVRGINILPVTGGSLYLGLHPTYDQQFINQLAQEYGSNQWQNWPDILWEFQSFYDPTEAINLFNANPNYTPEGGESKAHTYSWLYNMQALGQVNASVTANTPLYSVFTNNGQNTYVADNPGSSAITVNFSDGTTLNVPAYSMAWTGAQTGSQNNHTGVSTGSSGGSTGGSGSGSGSGSGTGSGSGSGGTQNQPYTQSVQAVSSSAAKVTFTPTTSMQYVIVHYTVNGGTQQNVTMTLDAGGGYDDTISGLKSGDVVTYNFTYNEGGVQHDTQQYSYTFGQSTGGGSQTGQTETTSDFTSTYVPQGTTGAVTFTPNQSSLYVIVHYTVNGTNQQNVQMAAGSGGQFTYTISGLASGETVGYSFTYTKNGLQYDSPSYTYQMP